MKLLIDTQTYADPPYVAEGGIAWIHSLGKGEVAKVYKPQFRNQERRRKVLALCSSYRTHTTKFGRNQYAFPKHPAYESTTYLNDLVGFSMQDFGDIPEMANLGLTIWDWTYQENKGVKFNEDTAIEFVYRIFEAVEQLHRARIVLGDVNARNILCTRNDHFPVIIDLDSAQIGSFACLDHTPAHLAPELYKRGTNLANGYVFDSGTDIYSLASVCFEFLIGVGPHFVNLKPSKSEIVYKQLGISSIRCFATTTSYLSALGFSYLDIQENKMIEKRLSWLKSKDRFLYDFFFSIFVLNERNNLLTYLSPTDKRHPGHHFLGGGVFVPTITEIVQERAKATLPPPAPPIARKAPSSRFPNSGFRELIASLAGTHQQMPQLSQPQNLSVLKSDPPEFAAFLEQFNLSVK